MNVVDSSGWLEYFAEARNAGFFAPPIEKTAELLVPSITILEVYKRVLEQRDEDSALQAVALMSQGRVLDLDLSIALQAAQLGRQHKLPLADSIILASARSHRATLWTQDADFKSLPGVNYVPARKVA